MVAVAFSPDGRLLAACSAGGVVTVFDADTMRVRFARDCHDGYVIGLSFTPDGRRLASGAWDKTVHIMDAATGETVTRLTGTSLVHGIALSPDGARLVCAQRDQTVRLWDVASGHEVAALHGHGSRVATVAFSPDGATLASGSGDWTVRLWCTTPLADQLRRRQAILNRAAEATVLVDPLFDELSDPAAVAAALRADDIHPQLRRAALNEVLRRSVEP